MSKEKIGVSKTPWNPSTTSADKQLQDFIDKNPNLGIAGNIRNNPVINRGAISNAILKARASGQNVETPEIFRTFSDTSSKLLHSSNLPDSQTIVDSTTPIRRQEGVVKTDSSDLLTDMDEYLGAYQNQLDTILGQTPFGATAEGGAYQNELNDLRKSLGITGTEDEYAQRAGERATAGYAPVIAEAEEARRKGMPKATIRGGERGGFMSTQMAGSAALQQTEGGDFIGAGGELEEIKSDYDNVIFNLKTKAENARAEAEASARKAFRTGKIEDYERAREASEDAKASAKEAIQLANDKADAINNFIKTKQSITDYSAGIDDASKQDATDQLNYYMDNFGLEYVEANKDQIASLLEQAGYEDADLDTMIESMRKEEESASGNTFKLRNDANGNLVNYELDPEGRIVGENMISGKIKSGGGSGGGGGEEDASKFFSDIEKATKNLRGGATWGQEWNRLYSMYQWQEGDGTPEEVKEENEELAKKIDRMLDKSKWSKGGAYEEFKES